MGRMSEHREREDQARYDRYDEGLDPWGFDEFSPANLDESPFAPAGSVGETKPLNAPVAPWRCKLCLEYRTENHCDCGGVVELEAA